MNALTQPQTMISEADYLAHYAQDADCKYEYINGEIWAMAGASRRHNMITINVSTALRQHLRGGMCFPFASDFRVQCGQNYYYPDVVVDCGKNDNNQASKPVLIIEVLSDSTRKTDLTFKLYDYQKIATLQEYCVIEQDFARVAVYRRSDDWKATEYAPNEVVPFDSIGYELAVADIYEMVVFES